MRASARRPKASRPNLNPITEEAAATLDPVTERLMAIMREKGQA
jgi:hypothetical protein